MRTAFGGNHDAVHPTVDVEVGEEARPGLLLTQHGDGGAGNGQEALEGHGLRSICFLLCHLLDVFFRPVSTEVEVQQRRPRTGHRFQQILAILLAEAGGEITAEGDVVLNRSKTVPHLVTGHCRIDIGDFVAELCEVNMDAESLGAIEHGSQ